MVDHNLTRLLKDYTQEQPHRALGGVRALSGFEYQIRAYLADFAQSLAGTGDIGEPGDQFANAMEAFSDYTRFDENLTVCVQVKRTLTTNTRADAATEFALIDIFLENRLSPAEWAKVRYECVARYGESSMTWEGEGASQGDFCSPGTSTALLSPACPGWSLAHQDRAGPRVAADRHDLPSD